MIVNCVDLGDPPVVNGVPPPVLYHGDGINSSGIVAAFVEKLYPDARRVVAVCLITPAETFTFTSPFGFTEILTPLNATLGDDKIVFTARDQDRKMRVVIGDSNSRTVLTTLPGLNREMWATWVAGGSIFGVYAMANNVDSESGTFEIHDGAIDRLRIPGYKGGIHLNAISPNAKHRFFLARPDNEPDLGEWAHLFVSEGNVQTFDRNIRIHDINNAGLAVATSENSEIVLFMKGAKTTREISVAQFLGRRVGRRLRINSSGVVAGTCYANDKEGIFLIVDDKVIDLMTQPSIKQYGFSDLHVSGFNDLNQILVEGIIEGQEGSRLYRCDVDL